MVHPVFTEYVVIRLFCFATITQGIRSPLTRLTHYREQWTLTKDRHYIPRRLVFFGRGRKQSRMKSCLLRATVLLLIPILPFPQVMYLASRLLPYFRGISLNRTSALLVSRPNLLKHPFLNTLLLFQASYLDAQNNGAKGGSYNLLVGC